MLLAGDGTIAFPADQVLARISPNVSVWPWEPHADPLRDYLQSLAMLRDSVPADALVLAAHNLPFIGLSQRANELVRHHAERCELVADACAEPRSAAEIIPFLFRRPLDPHQTSFAFGETLAHLNYMLGRGELACEDGADGVLRYRAA
jgi:glyoxylase-like metal-dependent hydrolase (beta-lactamase superfamily II)